MVQSVLEKLFEGYAAPVNVPEQTFPNLPSWNRSSDWGIWLFRQSLVCLYVFSSCQHLSHILWCNHRISYRLFYESKVHCLYILSDLLVLKTNHKVLGVIISISCNRMQCNPISSVCFHSSMCPEFNLPMVVHMHRNNCNVLLSVGDLNDIDMSLSS